MRTLLSHERNAASDMLLTVFRQGIEQVFMAKKQDKYYKLKTDANLLLYVEEGKTLIDEENKWEEISESEYNARLQIRDLKIEIAQTDYIACKLAECDTAEERAIIKSTYATQLARRNEIRALINELEESL